MEELLSFFNLQIVIDVALVALRVILPIFALIIVFQIYTSLRRHRREEKPLIMLVNKTAQTGIPVLCWESSIGRGKGCDITLNDTTVSRDHAVLLRRQEGWFITDTGSRSGTYVNGEAILGRQPVYIDDEIQIGSTILQVKRAQEFVDIGRSWFFSKPKNKTSISPCALMILVSIFLFFMAVEACLSYEHTDLQPIGVFTVFMGVSWIFYVISTYALKRIGFELESLAIFLSGIGVMLSVRQELRQTYVQIAAMTVGMFIFCFLIKFLENPDRVSKWRLVIMILALGLLAVNIALGTIKGGAANWIVIGGVSVQPSEFVKICFIFVGASTLDYLQTKKSLIEFIIFSALCVGALFIMSDLGTALIFFGTFLIISFMRSGDLKTVILAVAAAVFGSVIVLKFKPYIADRFSAWRHCFEFQQTTGYQQARVLTYAASGGLIGVGLGNGCLKYVAASESDLVFGLICEELGLVMAVIVALSIVLLAFYTRAITTKSRSTFYSISACCAAGLLILQSSLNIFGATDILPLTGVTLPFVSAGGSSMMACWGLLAFIKAADERTYAVRKPKQKKLKQNSKISYNVR